MFFVLSYLVMNYIKKIKVYVFSSKWHELTKMLSSLPDIAIMKQLSNIKRLATCILPLNAFTIKTDVSRWNSCLDSVRNPALKKP